MKKYKVTTSITVTVYADDEDDASFVTEQALKTALDNGDFIDADLSRYYEYEEVTE